MSVPARRRARQRGFGLLEAVICISLMSLLFLGAMTMIITAGRSTVRTQAQVSSNGDAANAIQNIIGQLREASAFSLPTSSAAGQPESTWISVGNVSLGQFSTGMNGETINTGIEVVTPPTLTAQANGYTAQVVRKDGTVGLPNGLRVLSVTPGSYWETNGGGWPVAPTSVQMPGGLGIQGSAISLIYRGDPDGTPDPDPTGNPNPKAGTYLWQYTVPPTDASFNPTKYPNNLAVICKSVATVPNAVQFVRPSYGSIAEVNQVEIKIISSYYSPINGRQTSEEGNGAASSQLSGKCVYMRNHCTAGSQQAPSNTGARLGNNAFQYN